jgi:hypothetical protein
MENIIKHGAYRCFVFQLTVFLTGILLLIFGPLGIEALWGNPVILLKIILLLILTSLLSYVHLSLQPKIESVLEALKPNGESPKGLREKVRPYRIRRKNLATLCLFLVITIIILGMQVYATYPTF